MFTLSTHHLCNRFKISVCSQPLRLLTVVKAVCKSLIFPQTGRLKENPLLIVEPDSKTSSEDDGWDEQF